MRKHTSCKTKGRKEKINVWHWSRVEAALDTAINYKVNLIAEKGGWGGMRKKSIQPTECNSRQATEISTRTRIILTSNRETHCAGQC